MKTSRILPTGLADCCLRSIRLDTGPDVHGRLLACREQPGVPVAVYDGRRGAWRWVGLGPLDGGEEVEDGGEEVEDVEPQTPRSLGGFGARLRELASRDPTFLPLAEELEAVLDGLVDRLLGGGPDESPTGQPYVVLRSHVRRAVLMELEADD